MPVNSDSLTASIHRVLLLRLTVATIVLSVLFAALAFYKNQQRIEEEVVELAHLRVNQFAQSIEDLLESPAELTSAVLKRRFDEFIPNSGPVVIRDGHFVLVHIYGKTGRLLLDVADESFAALSAVRQAVEEADIAQLKADDFHVITTELAGLSLVGVAVPLNNSANEVAAQVVGVFAISTEAIEAIRGDILLTML